jgi:hypothetical protein
VFQNQFMVVSCIGGRKLNTYRWKPPTYCKSPTSFITWSCIEYTSPKAGSLCKYLTLYWHRRDKFWTRHNIVDTFFSNGLQIVSQPSSWEIHSRQKLQVKYIYWCSLLIGILPLIKLLSIYSIHTSISVN